MEWTTDEIRYCLDGERVSEAATSAVFFAADQLEEQAEEIERLRARIATLEAERDERAALLSQAISHAKGMEARHEKTTSHTFELYAMLSQRNARIAALEATQTPERVAAWKLEGAREEREAVVAWLDTKPRNLEEKTCYPPESRDRVLARAIRKGDHKKGEAK